MDRARTTPSPSDDDRLKQSGAFLRLIYVNAFVSGAVIMAFEILGSRYLNPYFGSGIYTWSALIATVLIALMVGYFIGGWIADRRPSHTVLASLILASACYMAVVPLAADPILGAIFDAIESVRIGSLIAALVLLFVPLTLLGVYSPFGIRLTLRSTSQSGTVAGRIYGISTFGSVFGTLFTTFYLIPTLGSRSITYLLAATALVSGLSFLVLVPAIAAGLRRAAAVVAALLLALPAMSSAVQADEGSVAGKPGAAGISEVIVETRETEYNNIFITRTGDFLRMSFRVRRFEETESVANLRDRLELPLAYARTMTVGLVYPDNLRNLLMIGLGGGTITDHITHFVPELDVTVAELDEGVVAMAKKHFGFKEGPHYRVVTQDGRVFLMRNRKARYDIIMVDAFRGGYVPFHLLTQEFYELLKARLAPGGVAVFNIHGNTRLFTSTMRTLHEVFGHVEAVPAAGSYITIVRNGPPVTFEEAQRRAAERQAKYKFRYDLRNVLKDREAVTIDTKARILTDDFAPVNLYESIDEHNKKR